MHEILSLDVGKQRLIGSNNVSRRFIDILNYLNGVITSSDLDIVMAYPRMRYWQTYDECYGNRKEGKEAICHHMSVASDYADIHNYCTYNNINIPKNFYKFVAWAGAVSEIALEYGVGLGPDAAFEFQKYFKTVLSDEFFHESFEEYYGIFAEEPNVGGLALVCAWFCEFYEHGTVVYKDEYASVFLYEEDGNTVNVHEFCTSVVSFLANEFFCVSEKYLSCMLPYVVRFFSTSSYDEERAAFCSFFYAIIPNMAKYEQMRDEDVDDEKRTLLDALCEVLKRPLVTPDEGPVLEEGDECASYSYLYAGDDVVVALMGYNLSEYNLDIRYLYAYRTFQKEMTLILSEMKETVA